MAQHITLYTARDRLAAKSLIDAAPERSLVKVAAPSRSREQNNKMWAMLSEIARAKPGGRDYPAEVWKCLFMSAFGHEIRWIPGLSGEPVPAGYRSSRMSVGQMCDLIEFMQSWCAQNGVELSQ